MKPTAYDSASFRDAPATQAFRSGLAREEKEQIAAILAANPIFIEKTARATAQVLIDDANAGNFRKRSIRDGSNPLRGSVHLTFEIGRQWNILPHVGNRNPAG